MLLRRNHVSRRDGFTLVEMMVAISVFAITTAFGLPRIGDAIRHGRVNQAVNVVSGDLEMALSLAARQRKPIRISYLSGNAYFEISDRNSGTLVKRRSLGSASDWRLTTLSFSAATIDVYPGGTTSGPLTIALGIGDYTRSVTMSRAGIVRVFP